MQTTREVSLAQDGAQRHLGDGFLPSASSAGFILGLGGLVTANHSLQLHRSALKPALPHRTARTRERTSRHRLGDVGLVESMGYKRLQEAQCAQH